MAGYIGKSQGVTQVDGYNRSEADAEFVQTTGDTMTGNLVTPMVVANSALSNRNLIINGAMQVAQRGTSFSYNSFGNAGFSVDRFWFYNAGAATSGTVEQSTDVPTGQGFTYSLFNNTNAGMPSGTNVELTKQGNAAPFVVGNTYTLSFWVKGTSASTGNTMQITWRNSHANGSNSTQAANYPTFDITTSWARVVIPFTLNASPVSTNMVLDFEYAHAAGVKITGFQLEAGDTATPFEHRSIGQELALCQRYFQSMGDASNTSRIADTFGWTTSIILPLVRFPVEMRAAPSFSASDVTLGAIEGNTSGYTTNITSNVMSKQGGSLNCATSAGLTANNPYMFSMVAGGYLRFDAEL